MPLVFEALNFTRPQAALAGSANAVAGRSATSYSCASPTNFGAIAIIVMPLMAIPLLLAAAFVDPGHAGFLALFALIALFLIGAHLVCTVSPAFSTRALIVATALAGNIGREDRIYCPPLCRRGDSLDEPASPRHLRGACDLSGRLCRLHLHCRTNSLVDTAARIAGVGADPIGRDRGTKRTTNHPKAVCARKLVKNSRWKSLRGKARRTSNRRTTR